MTPPPAEALLKHLPRLYAFAQLVTPDPAAAARLVRATYARAFEEMAPENAGEVLPEATGQRLYRLLLDVRREERGEAPPIAPAPAHFHDAPDDLATSRERHAHRLVDFHLPPALVSLDTADRLVLYLCNVEGLSCEEAAPVLGVTPPEGCAHYDRARAALRSRILAAVSVHERPMLEEILTDEKLRAGIGEALQDELAPVPPTLRPQITPPAPEPPPAPAAPDPFGRWIKTGYLLLLLFALGIAAYLLFRQPPAPPETNLIVLAARSAPQATFPLETSDAAVAETFVEEHAGWRLSLPAIGGYTLAGVGIDELAPGVSVPAFRYAGADSSRLVLYAVTYSLLDQAAGAVSLENDVLLELEDDAHFELHDIEGTQVLLWRNRDDLFLAVTPTPDGSLARRIQP